jgi:hypothetical protein
LIKITHRLPHQLKGTPPSDGQGSPNQKKASAGVLLLDEPVEVSVELSVEVSVEALLKYPLTYLSLGRSRVVVSRSGVRA